MRVLIDTNVFISAALFPEGRAAAALLKALTPPFQAVTCDYVIDELHRKFREKFPDRLTELDAFLYAAMFVIQIIPTPEEEKPEEQRIRDLKDRPILRAALAAEVELFLTGDKDFLDAGVEYPRIISVADFLTL